MRASLAIAIVASSLALSHSAQATGLLGSQVTGSIYFNGGSINYYDPGNGYVPSGFGNTSGLPVTIGGGTEFGFQDGANADNADFSDTQLVISDNVFSSATNWKQVFTLQSGAFTGISLVTDGFTPGLTYQIVDGSIVLNWDGTNQTNNFSATFDLKADTTGAVPEPGTWMTMAAGLGLIGFAMRRRSNVSLRYA